MACTKTCQAMEAVMQCLTVHELPNNKSCHMVLSMTMKVVIGRAMNCQIFDQLSKITTAKSWAARVYGARLDYDDDGTVAFSSQRKWAPYFGILEKVPAAYFQGIIYLRTSASYVMFLSWMAAKYVIFCILFE